MKPWTAPSVSTPSEIQGCNSMHEPILKPIPSYQDDIYGDPEAKVSPWSFTRRDPLLAYVERYPNLNEPFVRPSSTSKMRWIASTRFVKPTKKNAVPSVAVITNRDIS